MPPRPPPLPQRCRSRRQRLPLRRQSCACRCGRPSSCCRCWPPQALPPGCWAGRPRRRQPGWLPQGQRLGQAHPASQWRGWPQLGGAPRALRQAQGHQVGGKQMQGATARHPNSLKLLSIAAVLRAALPRRFEQAYPSSTDLAAAGQTRSARAAPQARRAAGGRAGRGCRACLRQGLHPTAELLGQVH